MPFFPLLGFGLPSISATSPPVGPVIGFVGFDRLVIAPAILGWSVADARLGFDLALQAPVSGWTMGDATT